MIKLILIGTILTSLSSYSGTFSCDVTSCTNYMANCPDNIYVLEIIEEFHSLYTNQHVKKITKLENIKKIKNVDIDDVIISNLEYSNDPIKLMNDVNKT